MERKSVRNLTVFVAAVLASGWLGVLVDSFLDDQPEGNTLGMGLWLLFPLLTVVALRVFAGEGWKAAGLTPRLKQGWQWYIVAVLVYPVVTALVLLIGYAAGWVELTNLRIEALAGVFISLLFGQFIKNIFEEFVWRGYLTAKLVQKGMKDWSIYLIAGLVWGLWHLPYYLFFLPKHMMYSVLPVDKLLFALVAIVSMIAWSIMFVELFRVTNSIWPGVLMHAVEDSLLNPLVIDGYITIASGKEIWISPITGIAATLLYVVVGLLIRAVRLRRDYPKNAC
ncbi:type II CAAX prenyl endopeptidase Rce1 family protein [Paenibacillus septentrionalis]|uniref:Type II CAAX prenyl endopeptidase Rce1 family protein n=1 Tax=Paenibacillus septentrionalis TaxID=429342 RepID=A0ABW1V1S9_9BACL